MVRRFARAVVTGGAGFLGALACRRLLEQGTAVVCLDNLLSGNRGAVPASTPDGPPCEFRFCDVIDPFDVPGPVDLVLHLASPSSPADYARYPLQTMECGSLGTRNALQLAARKGARFVLASTSEVYGDPQVSPQREDYFGNVNPIGPRSVYDEAKRYAEALTAAYHRVGQANAAIARIFNSYGPGMRPDDGRMVPTFICQALRGDPVTVTGDGTQTRSLCHADDTVRGLLLLAASDFRGTVNIGNPDEATVRQIAARIIGLAKSDSPIRYVPRPPDDPMSRKPDITLARNQLGFAPQVGWQEGLLETIDWFRRVLTGPTVMPREQGPAAGWLLSEHAWARGLENTVPQHAGGVR
jgi:dTDP-glucose 4,6-dehydratase